LPFPVKRAENLAGFPPLTSVGLCFEFVEHETKVPQRS
jgi:hypothetical protein